MSRLVSTITACLVLVAVAAGCGADPDEATDPGSSEEASSSSSESVEPAESTEPAFDPATATLTDARFCDDLDVAVAESGLGMAGGELELTDERVVGKKYKSPFSGEMYPSMTNSCSFGDAAETAYVLVSVVPVATAQDVEGSLKAKADFVGKEGQSDKCSVVEETTFGDPGGVALCEGVNFDSTKGRADVSIVSLVGSSRFYCQAGLVKGSTPAKIEQPVRDLCLDVLQQLTAG